MLIAPLPVAGIVTCGATTSAVTPTVTPASTPTSADPSSAVATIDLGTTALGTVLTDAQGHTLYLVSSEASGQDACTMEPRCALMWPALAPPRNATPVPGVGVNGTLGVITAADGSAEVTYNGWPLHTFSGEGTGQVTGQGTTTYGGTWSVATPDVAPTLNPGVGGSMPGLATPPGTSTPPGVLPTNPFAPTTPPGMPTQPAVPTIPSAPDTSTS